MASNTTYAGKRKVRRALRLAETERRLDELTMGFGSFAMRTSREIERLYRLLYGSCWVRLRWALFGTLPTPQTAPPDPSSSTPSPESEAR